MARNKRDIPSIVSGAGLTAAFWTMVGEEGRKRDLLDEEYHQLGTSEGRKFAIQLVESIIAARPGVQSKPAIVLPAEVRALIPDWLKPNPIEHVPATDFSVEKIEFVIFLNPGESSVDSKTVRDRAVTLQGNLGLADAPRILVYLNKTKPKELQGCYIVLPGTVLSASDGGLHVPCLYWGGTQWFLDFFWLGSGWYDGGRFARCR